MAGEGGDGGVGDGGRGGGWDTGDCVVGDGGGWWWGCWRLEVVVLEGVKRVEGEVGRLEGEVGMVVIEVVGLGIV